MVRNARRYLRSSLSSISPPSPASAPVAGGLGLPRVLFDGERVVVIRALERPVHRAPVDEQRRRRTDADAGGDVARDARAGLRRVEAGAERWNVQRKVARVAEEAVAIERALVLEERVVVLPEAVLLAGALRRKRRTAGIRMRGAILQRRVARGVERKVAEDEAHVVARAQQVLEIPEGLGAGRAFEVRELDDGDGRVGVALGVLLAADDLGERPHGELQVEVVEARVARLHLGQGERA